MIFNSFTNFSEAELSLFLVEDMNLNCMLNTVKETFSGQFKKKKKKKLYENHYVQSIRKENEILLKQQISYNLFVFLFSSSE